MSLLSRIKVRIKSRMQLSPRRPIQIEVKEKEVYICRVCSNRYHSYYRFCPQCLGELRPSQLQSASLFIVSVRKEKIGDAEQVLRSVSGRKDFDFQKPLRSLPWLMIGDSDIYILNQWKDVLEAEKIKAEIRENPNDKKRRSIRPRPILYSKGAPLPFFISPATEAEVRTVSKQIQDPGLKLQWVEIVIKGFGIVESFYKKDPGHRILFSDFMYQIDNELLEFCKKFHTYLKARPDELESSLAKVRSQIAHMESEIHEVRKHVESQL